MTVNKDRRRIDDVDEWGLLLGCRRTGPGGCGGPLREGRFVGALRGRAGGRRGRGVGGAESDQEALVGKEPICGVGRVCPGAALPKERPAGRVA